MVNGRSSLAKAVLQHVDGMRSFNVGTIPLKEKPKRLSKADRLSKLVRDVKACKNCSLYKTRTNIVISDGNPNADLVFIGEAPGRDEDLQGVPFVGRAGKLLTKMIIAMGYDRSDVYICNVLKDRPPANRTPQPDEMAACLPFLHEQISIVKPKVLCTLGAVATRALLGPDITIGKVRGKVHKYEGVDLVPTFHPAYLLRNPAAKKDTWQDLQVVMKLLKKSKS